MDHSNRPPGVFVLDHLFIGRDEGLGLRKGPLKAC
jgi:hypothetical protein